MTDSVCKHVSKEKVYLFSEKLLTVNVKLTIIKAQ
nr:MAG TPA: hypothetical protein [Myoviridae sp. ctyhU11]